MTDIDKHSINEMAPSKQSFLVDDSNYLNEHQRDINTLSKLNNHYSAKAKEYCLNYELETIYQEIKVYMNSFSDISYNDPIWFVINLLNNCNIYAHRFQQVIFYTVPYGNYIKYIFEESDVDTLAPYILNFNIFKTHPIDKSKLKHLFAFLTNFYSKHKSKLFSWPQPTSYYSLIIATRNALLHRLCNEDHSPSFNVHNKQEIEAALNDLFRLPPNVYVRDFHRPIIQNAEIYSNSSNLSGIFRDIFNYNILLLHSFLQLIAICILGHRFCDEMLDKTYPKLTIIKCTNKQLLRDLLIQLFTDKLNQQEIDCPISYDNISKISYKNNYIIPLHNSIMYNIFINIDCVDINPKVKNEFFKKLILSKEFTVNEQSSDSIFGNIRFKNETHYIYITEDTTDIEKIFANNLTKPYNIIEIGNNIANYHIENALSYEECTFIKLLAISMVLEEDNSIENSNVERETIHPSDDDILKHFIDQFIENMVPDFDYSSISEAINKHNFTEYSDAERMELASELGINKLDCISRLDYITALTKFIEHKYSSFKDPETYAKKLFTSYLNKMKTTQPEHYTFYIKSDGKQQIYSDKTTNGGKALYGVRLKVKELEAYLQSESIRKESTINNKESFDAFWKKLIDMVQLFDFKESVDPNDSFGMIDSLAVKYEPRNRTGFKS